ncbi:hypothetical protein [Bacterioplanoides sp.]|uniref:hypothetical protein n=1 Tax=Bacterioplanoides sp. TaxID=2066072 RepID=UPI003B00D783
MRREAIYNSVSRIIKDLQDCDIQGFIDNIFEHYRGRDSENKNSLPLKIFHKYMLATSNYSDDDIEVCRIIGIDDLLTPDFWQNLSEPSGRIHEVYSSVNFALNHLPKLLMLSKQHYVQDIKDQSGDIPEELKGKTLLTLLILEDDEQFSSPKRLTSALSSIADLYEVVSTIDNESPNELIVLACDSGSDKSFDFLGLAKVVEQVKEIIITIWDRRVLHRHREASETLSLISESLPILEKIDRLKDSGAIEREQAELLKRKTISGVTQFFEAGVIIPELESESSHAPKQLMKPEPKLLVSPWSRNKETPPVYEAEAEEDTSTELSPEEEQMLDLLMKKAGNIDKGEDK